MFLTGMHHTGHTMITTRTIIGMVVGGAIIVLAGASLVLDLVRGPLEITETFGPGESTSYQIAGDAGAVHTISVAAERFEIRLDGPGGGPSVPRTEFLEEYSLEWTHLESGRTAINLWNTGGTDMVVSGTFSVPVDSIRFVYHIVVITSGVVIIGFSMGFSLRKPRGF